MIGLKVALGHSHAAHHNRDAVARDIESFRIGGAADSEALDVSGNCIAIVVRGVRMAESDLEADHREASKLTPTVALLDSQEIDAAVRVALTALRAKKY